MTVLYSAQESERFDPDDLSCLQYTSRNGCQACEHSFSYTQVVTNGAIHFCFGNDPGSVIGTFNAVQHCVNSVQVVPATAAGIEKFPAVSCLLRLRLFIAGSGEVKASLEKLRILDVTQESFAKLM